MIHSVKVELWFLMAGSRAEPGVPRPPVDVAHPSTHELPDMRRLLWLG